MEKWTGGYLVEYSESKGLFDGFGDRKTAVCSDKKLIEMLQKKTHYAVWRTNFVQVGEYHVKHPEVELIGFDE